MYILKYDNRNIMMLPYIIGIRTTYQRDVVLFTGMYVVKHQKHINSFDDRYKEVSNHHKLC